MLEVSNKKPKTKQDYSRNVKLLKLKIEKAQSLKEDLQRKLENAKQINNDRMIAFKLSKFCKERKFTPQMLFRFADRNGTGQIDKVDWKNTLSSLGLKLNAEQMQKMILLIDQDISGKVSMKEYYAYLSAFNIRAESSEQEPFIVSGVDKLNKMLLEKTIGIKYQDIADKNRTEDDKITKRKKEGHKYITYEEFYKYCKKYFPELKDKELISIFNRLDPEGHGVISVEELNILLKENSRKSQQILDKKNKKLIRKETKENISSLKDELSMFLFNRVRRGLFHLSEFKTIGTKINNKARMGQLFRQIDANRVGSFDYNQVLNFYLKKKPPGDKFTFAYLIMQIKIDEENKRIEQMLFLNKLSQGSQLTQKVFSDFLKSEFNVDEKYSLLMYDELVRDSNTKRLQCRHLVIKFRQVAKQTKGTNIYKADLDNIITLNYFGTKMKDFLRKGVGTIVKNPMVALKFCVQLQAEILKQARQKWSDFEFGPIHNDPRGYMSVSGISDSEVSKALPTENQLIWIRATDLGFTDFYSPTQKPLYQQGAIRKHSLLSALSFLIQSDKQFLYRDTLPPAPTLQKLTNKQLQPVFLGLYPRIFHYFSKYGIYVFRFFISDSWAYVMIDDLLPCTLNKEPIFATSGTKKYSWIPLVEKAYAKIKGGYYRLFTDTTMFEAVYELSHSLSLEIPLVLEKLKSQKVKDDKWAEIRSFFPPTEAPRVGCINTDKVGNLEIQGVNTNFRGNQSLKIEYVMEVEDVQSQNYHHSHRLIIIKKPQNFEDQTWNINWSQEVPDSKFFDVDQEIKDELRKLKNYNVLLTSSFIINYSKFRQLFNNVFTFKDVSSINWQGSRAIDKTDQKKDGYFFTEYRIRLSSDSPAFLTIYCLDPSKSKLEFSLCAAEKPQQFTQTTRRLSILHQPTLKQGNYLLTIKSAEPINLSVTIYLKNRSYKIKKVPGDADFEDIKELERMAFDEDSAGEKAMEYLNHKAFKLNLKRGTGCCG